MRFEGKVAIVTGGSLGIGAACVAGLVREGAHVVMASLDTEAGQRLADSLAEVPGTAVHVTADVSREQEVAQLVESTLSRHGRLDILVNNAGIYRQGTAEESTLDDWQAVIAVNLTGVFLCTKYAVPALKQTHGTIVNIASEAGVVGIAGQAAYNVSKAGVIALTRSCAVDFAADGVRVNSVCPGTTWTPLVEAAVGRAPDPDAARRRLETVRPMNRLGTPDEIAAAVLFLAGQEAGYATGASLSVDGGYTAQ